MSLMLDTGVLNYRTSSSGPWRPIAIKMNLEWESLADIYSESGTYAVGEYVLYDGVLYRCISAITSGEAWTAAHWTAVDFGAELEKVVRDMAPEYSATSTYPEVGTVCMHEGVLYKNTSAINTAEEWTAAHWAQTTVGEMIGKLEDKTDAIEQSMAYIVGDTNTSGHNLASGEFVYVKDHATIPDGLRKANTAISQNISITTSNTDAVSGGGLNDLRNSIKDISIKRIINSYNASSQNLSITLNPYTIYLLVVGSYSGKTPDAWFFTTLASGSSITQSGTKIADGTVDATLSVVGISATITAEAYSVIEMFQLSGIA